MQANELRGEVDIELDGQNLVMRPSYSAILEVEKSTRKSLIELATAAGDGALSLAETAIVVTAFVKVWLRAQGDEMVDAWKVERIGELILDLGLMKVLLRLTLVLQLAATGGYRSDGTRKDDDDEGEAMATGEKTSATPAAASQE